MNEDETFINENIIVENWKDYIDFAKNKYKRRIDRLIKYLTSCNSIIFLYRYNDIYNVNSLCACIKRLYPSLKFAFVVASTKHDLNKNYDNVFFCNPEKNGIWNETSEWMPGITLADAYLKL